jgi:hypothetical protein
MTETTDIIAVTSLRVADELPATPQGLLDIADVFERGGYHRLATYLRACADQMAGKLPAEG